MLISARSNLGRVFCVDYFPGIKRRQFQFNLPERRICGMSGRHYYKTTPGIGSPAKERLNENRTLTIELREQCLGLLQVLGVEAFGEPVVDLG